MWLLFNFQQHFVHRDIWTEIFRFINRTQPLRQASHNQALVELNESWQELFDKSIWVKRIAQRALEVTGRDEGVYPGRGYEEQPPADTLIPPTIPAREGPRGMPEKKGSRGPSLPKRKGSSPGAFPNEKLQAEAHQSVVEAVHRITSSCSSLESSAKYDKGDMARGDWVPRMMGLRWMKKGPELLQAHQKGVKREAQRTKGTLRAGEKHLKGDRCPHSERFTR